MFLDQGLLSLKGSIVSDGSIGLVEARHPMALLRKSG
jgi:hypothetical protein